MQVNKIERELRKLRSTSPSYGKALLTICKGKKPKMIVWVGKFSIHDGGTFLKSGQLCADVRREVGQFNGDDYSFEVTYEEK